METVVDRPDEIVSWQGRAVAEMTREELLVVVQNLGACLYWERKRGAAERVMWAAMVEARRPPHRLGGFPAPSSQPPPLK